jgi:hypothetical protein
MEMDRWQPIDTAPTETTILLGLKEGGELKRCGLGSISRPPNGKPIEYQWKFIDAPTHWKPVPWVTSAGVVDAL